MKEEAVVDWPELRRKVLECCEKLAQEGWVFRRANNFVSVGPDYSFGFNCCAIGAISVCHKKTPNGTTYRFGSEAFALSKQHLKCSSRVLEDIERGFEGNAFNTRSTHSKGYKIGAEVFEIFGWK